MTRKNRSIDVTIVGLLFIIAGLFVLPVPIYLYTKIAPIDFPFYVKANILLILVTTFTIFVHIISGVGLLKVRFWARYIAIALLITLPLGQLNTVLMFGSQSFSLVVFINTIIIASIVLWIITRRKFKEQFENADVRFKLKSKHGVIIILIILIAALLVPIMVFSIKIYVSLKFNEPFIISAPKEIKILPANSALFSDKYKRVELFDISFLVPNDFVIRTFHKSSDDSTGWNVMTVDPNIKNGFISLQSKSLLDRTGLYKSMHFENAYDFEKAIYTNNYSPFLMGVRIMLNGISNNNFSIELIDHPAFRGFLKSRARQNADSFIYEISFYSKSTLSSKSMMFMSKDTNWNKENILDIISLVTFTGDDTSKASRYYKEGVDLLAANSSSDAQFKLANAYYLAPDNPEYGYMFAKLLFQQNTEISFSARAILEDVLKIKPDYKEARELLNTIEIILGQ